MVCDGRAMNFGGIAFVAAESVFGVQGIDLGHDAVPGHLGHNGSRRNGYAKRIPFFYSLLGQIRSDGEYAVDEKMRRPRLQVGHRHGHGTQRGLQDIDAVDLGTVNDTDTDGVINAFDNCPGISNEEQDDLDGDGVRACLLFDV